MQTGDREAFGGVHYGSQIGEHDHMNGADALQNI
jgi:hypothetical protein